MKRIFALALALVMTLPLAACGNKQGNTNSSGENMGSAEYIINCGFDDPDGSITHKMLTKFKDAVERGSNGRMQVNLYPGSLLGSDTAVAEGVLSGMYQMVYLNPSNISTMDARLSLYALPYAFSSESGIYASLEGEIGDQFKGWLSDLGYEFLTMTILQPYGVLNNVRPVTCPDDMKGLKIRTPEAETYVQITKLLGATPIVAAWGELFTGLQQGTFDGVCTGPSSTVENQFNTVCKYYTETAHMYDVVALLIGKNFMDTLPEELQALVRDSIVSIEDEWREARNDDNITALEEMKKTMEIYELSESEKKAFYALGAPMLENYYDTFGGKEFFNLCQSYT